MTLYRRSPTSAWYVNLRLPDGTRLRESTGYTDKRKAEAAERALIARLEATHAASADGSRPIALGEALSLYVASLRSDKKRSADNFETLANKAVGLHQWEALGRFALPPALLLHELTPTHLEKLKQARLKEGNRAQTVKHELSLLRATCRYVKGLHYRVPGIDNWRLPTTPVKTRYLSVEEFQAVYRAMDPQRPHRRPLEGGRTAREWVSVGVVRTEMQDAQDLLLALALCGGRWGEVAALTWDRVDLEAGSIRLFATKGHRGERTVAIPEQFAQVLQRRHRERVHGAGPLVFPGKFGRQRVQSSRAISKAMEACGLNRPDIVERYGRATVHSLRHTFASWLLQGGADLSEVQEAVGHTTVSMTRRYAHLSKAKTLSKMGGILSNLGDLG